MFNIKKSKKKNPSKEKKKNSGKEEMTQQGLPVAQKEASQSSLGLWPMGIFDLMLPSTLPTCVLATERYWSISVLYVS